MFDPRSRPSGRPGPTGPHTSRRYLTTYVQPWSEEWGRRTRPYDVRRGRARALAGLLRVPGPALLNGSTGFERAYVDLIAAAILGRRDGPVLLADATWEPGSRKADRLLHRKSHLGYDPQPRSLRWISKALIRAMDSENVHYAVLSSDELQTFPRLWGISPRRVHHTPFCATAREPFDAPSEAGVFASGNSLRDYRPLIDAAPMITAPVTIASSLAFDERRVKNLTIDFFSPAEHEERMRAAAVVVVALLPGTERSAGQQTYLNAMACGKAVVVTEAPGVRDYVTDGETGIVVSNDTVSLTAAVNRLLGDTAEAARLGANARSMVMSQFTVRHYLCRLLELADSL